ncbi:hypothetical protein [uncultured Desulfobacter sp.]|uniref:hypothetical protein n=1 Tax=uncultured Desulfobacter sp. TaxID=240139 RepID=UPI002AAB7174|nr:hypothetical protein [uncultured Desulfobacter sp.]
MGILWTGLTFLLSQPPYNFGTETIGLFGLIGAAGALSANVAGRLGDRGTAGAMTGIFALLCILSWLSLAEGKMLLNRRHKKDCVLDRFRASCREVAKKSPLSSPAASITSLIHIRMLRFFPM